MGSATNVDAVAVNTIAWLAAAETSIVVPVYQRQYRWDIGGCEQLLADVRAVADAEDRGMHFIGSILSTLSTDRDDAELVLIDGQQRITTLMLLVAALHHIAQDVRPLLAAEMHTVLVRASDPDRTKLRPHRAWADVFERIVRDRPVARDDAQDSRFDSNYAFFRSQVRPDEVPRIWRGLQRLEHVAITLGAGAHAQQIFESLNSTGEPLRDHELIHNYVLMGLSHAEQTEIEDTFWVPIEQNTGQAIGSFWRDYLVMTTGREVSVPGTRGVYDAFRAEFPRLDLDSLRSAAAQWRAASDVYRALLHPAREPDAALARHLAHVNTFGRAMYPLLMRVYLDYRRGTTDAAAFAATLEAVQSLLLRRTVVGTGTDRLVARLCRAWNEGPDALTLAFARITPSDERVRVALKFGPLPHPAYVLGRLADVEDTTAVDIEHIVPLIPPDDWTGDGVRRWRDYSEDEQNSHRALAPTLGNLTLIEEPLAIRAFDAAFPTKRDHVYAESRIPLTADLVGVSEWNTAALSRRTAALTGRFLALWAKPPIVGIDDDGLTPVLDAVRRRGWPAGWQREFEYVEYRGEHWEVYDVKYLFNRIFRRLWADSRADVISFSLRRGGPVYDSPSWQGQWDALDDDTHLYMGWDSKYMLTAVQGVLEEAGIAAEVFVKYSYVGAAMR
ncbi:DUF262 domain-containing protein [Microbacterium sp. P02]|uniref:DUF262 domain-containing protein n=1 Tax=Microbacterium sp. P02 TaxID=3366260 RepID=UPI00366C1D58